jgi:pyruvate dehydrogenase E1 component alpha subunit
VHGGAFREGDGLFTRTRRFDAFFDKENHMYGGHAIVGAHVPLAAGMAFASKYRKEDRVTLCFFGDGAINQGGFHEALNLAGLFKLPVIFICENNFFAMGTSVKRSTSLEHLVDRAEGYDIPGEIVDGMNFREVRDKLSEIIASIRKDPHPAFVEARTYRYRGHSMSDPASYRTKEELEKYRLDDPITRLRAQLTREGKLSNEQFGEMDKRAKEEVLASVRFAEKSAEPPLEDLYKYTYLNGVEVDVSARKPCPSAGTAGKQERVAKTAAAGQEA